MVHGVAVSAIVAELAALVAEHRAPLTETESAIAGLVADMPRFMAEGRGLDTWEFELGNAHRRQRNVVRNLACRGNPDGKDLRLLTLRSPAGEMFVSAPGPQGDNQIYLVDGDPEAESPGIVVNVPDPPREN